MKEMKKSKSKFLKVSCPRCKHQKIIYGKSAIKIKCDKCNILLIKTTGGKTKIKAKVKEVF